LAGQSNVERTLGILLGKLEGIEDRLDRADESRAGMHRRLDEVVMRTTHVETDIMAVKNTVKEMQAVTDEITLVRERVLGAGTLGRWLWRLGTIIVSAAAGAATAYTWMTGKPPP